MTKPTWRLAPEASGEDDKNVWERTLRKYYEPLRSSVVEVPPEWGALARANEVFPRRCFQTAYRFVADFKPVPAAGLAGVWLVHGEYLWGQPHGWVELPRGVVFDGTMQTYYDCLGVSARYKYDVRATVLIMIRLEVNDPDQAPVGGWHLRLRLPWADRKNPTEVNYAEANRLLVAKGLAAAPRRRRWSDRS
jgi:hypothetical protein